MSQYSDEMYINWSVEESFRCLKSKNSLRIGRDDHELIMHLWFQLRMLGPGSHPHTFWKNATYLESMIKHNPLDGKMVFGQPEEHFLFKGHCLPHSKLAIKGELPKIQRHTDFKQTITRIEPATTTPAKRLCLIRACHDVYHGLNRELYLSFERPGALTKMVWGRFCFYRRKWRDDYNVLYNRRQAPVYIKRKPEVEEHINKPMEEKNINN